MCYKPVVDVPLAYWGAIHKTLIVRFSRYSNPIQKFDAFLQATRKALKKQ